VFAGHDGELLVVGEMPGVIVEDAVLFTDPERDEVDMVFQFEHMEVDSGHQKYDVAPFSLPKLKASLGRWQQGLAERGWNSLYWNNHDQPRVVSRFGDDKEFRERSAKMLGTVLHMHRGTPYVYQGEELGMTNTILEGIDDFRDIEAKNYYASAMAFGRSPADVLAALRFKGRDNARTPMQWDSSPQAGFTSGSPWIEVNPNYKEINADSQVDDPDSVFTYYRRLIELRHAEPVIALGDFTLLLPDDPSVYAFTRRLDEIELLVLGNFSSEDVFADVLEPDPWLGSELLLSNLDRGSGASSMLLAPWEARVYRRRT
jgi:oligo-1,6-glucosidase